MFGPALFSRTASLVAALAFATPAPAAPPARATHAAPSASDAAEANVAGPYDNFPPSKLFLAIRAVFRSHRPPPPFETYVLERKQLTDQGFPDYADSYKVKYWVRTSDRAALTRQIYRGINRGEMKFDRPAFNEERDPGPPTADVFEPAPAKPRPVTFVPTPEPAQTALQTLATISATAIFDYRITNVEKEGDELHLSVLPIRDADRNRLREIFADRKTLELRKLVATDKLFILGTSDVYGVTFTITMGSIANTPVVTDIHGVVGDGYSGDGSTIDYTFRNIEFPATLPAWYFDPKLYAANEKNEPM